MKSSVSRFFDLILHNMLWFVNAFLLVYAALPILAPILMWAGMRGPAGLIYLLYTPFCHQRPGHSFFILGYQVAYCARCTGIYSTLLLTGVWVAVWPLKRELVKMRTLVLMALPMALDGTLAFIFEILSYFTHSDPLYRSLNDMRLLSGWLFAFGVGLFLFTRLKEGVRNLDLSLPTEDTDGKGFVVESRYGKEALKAK